MRRFFVLTMASCCLLAIGPAAALARHHHRRHHHHARTERFGTLSTSTTTTGSPTTTPSPAGTVTSFSNGVLTIALSNSNSTVSGAVTQDTQIECQSSSTMGDDLATDGGPGGSNQGGDDQGDQGDQNDQGDQGDQGDDNGDQGQSCGTAALTPTATVVGAELEITSAGAVWTKIELG